MSAESKLLTSTFLIRKGRELANAARGVQGLEDDLIRRAVRTLYDLGKQAQDSRAKEIAANSLPEPTLGKRTNVGDPNAKGTSGKARR